MKIEFDPKHLDIAVAERLDQASLPETASAIQAEIERLTSVVNSGAAQSVHWSNLGCLYFEIGEFAESGQCFQGAVELDAFDEVAVRNSGDFHFHQKNYKTALEFYQRAATMRSDDGLHERMGDCLAAMNNIPAATAAYKTSAGSGAHHEAVEYKLRLIGAAQMGESLNVDAPYYMKHDICLTCYFPTENQAHSLHFQSNGLFRALEKLHNDRIELAFFHDDATAPKNAAFHRMNRDEVTGAVQKYLFDIFLSINDFRVFDRTIAAVTRMLYVDYLQQESELNQIASLCTQRKIDRAVFEPSLLEKFSRRAWQQFESGSIAFVDFDASLKGYIEELYLQQTLAHIETLLLSDNPIRAKKLLDKALTKFSDSELLQRKRNFMEQQYPHLTDEMAYVNLYEEQSKATPFDEEIFNHPCYAWLMDQLQQKRDILNILDVGCHKGEYALSLANLGYHVTGLDISEHNIHFAQTMTPPVYTDVSQVEWVRGKAHKLTRYFYGEQFDAALLFQILEHALDMSRVMNELKQVMKPNGHVFIAVLARPFENLRSELLSAEPRAGVFLRSFQRDSLRSFFHDQHNVTIDEIRDGEKLWYGVSFQLSMPAGCVREQKEMEPLHSKSRLETMFQTGYEYAAQGLFEKAFQEFMNIADFFPEQGRALYNAGVISDFMGEKDSAIVLLSKVGEFFPDMVEAFNYLGRIYFLEEDYEEALKQFKIAYSLDKSCETTLENLKLTAMKSGLNLTESELRE
ncbi:MAG: methyltransferase domain-containing protein [Candidatus Zhuqueibacterota bacterium]